ncbi:MAG: dimethylarginine dimethylaminohydrolase family protein [Methylocystis sp.]|uniref:dimethylarginine dimethylaminohydrolase family protein n=1 Tax=Methylocystis sp. TaxID=1911079 RepID=UPI003DA6B80C
MTVRFDTPTHATPLQSTGASILMCAPHHFGVDYIINPWMENQIGRTETTRAREQWDNLRGHLSACADVSLVTPEAGLPDMVFTANAGLALDGSVVVSRFQARERRAEEPLFRLWFERQGFAIAPWPEDVPFEGAGDALPDRARRLIWCGHGWRSSRQAPALLASVFGWETIGLKLVDPRFYHLDTCFCPLPGGWVMYYRAAFDEESLATIRALVPPGRRIEVGEADALAFACNAVEVEGRVFMNEASAALRAHLSAAGFIAVVTPLTEFLKAGGAAKCLTLDVTRDA